MDKKILVVDDNQKNIRLLVDILEDEDYTVYSTDDPLTVLDLAKEIKPEIILLDIMMPNLDGFQLCAMLKKDFDLKDIPVIMVTAKTEGTDLKKGLELGAFDYIKKPIDEVEVVARIQSALRYKEQQDKLKGMAMKDGLTGLYNHALLVELLNKELIKQERLNNDLAFAMLDIDYFKKVNDTYGHLVGDIVLRELANILNQSVRKSDIVGRYGGEEFGIVFPEINQQGVWLVCERIRQNIEKHQFDTGEQLIGATISIGICFKGSEDSFSSSEMIRRADSALYQAKRKGRNRVEFYSEEDSI